MNIDYLLIPKCSKWHSKNFIKPMSYPNGTDLLYTISVCSCSVFYKLTFDIKRFTKSPSCNTSDVSLSDYYCLWDLLEYVFTTHILSAIQKQLQKKLHSNHDKSNIHNFILSTVEQNTNFPFAHTSPEQELHAHPHRSVSHSTLGIHTTPVA